MRESGELRRVGVYGGTFDPIHKAHIAIAQAALEQYRLDLVLFVVAGRPPHKQRHTSASAEDRYEMVRAALEDQPRMEPSRVELDRDGPSYMVDTLAILQDRYPAAKLFLIMGMDSLIDLPNWREPERILDMAHVLVAPRPGGHKPPEQLEGRFDMLDFDERAVSSTGVRERVEQQGKPDHDVPRPVRRMVQEKGLYRD